jgi:predicted dehydrogenase
MGTSHARAYHNLSGYELAGLVDRNAQNRANLAHELGGIRQFDNLSTALAAIKPQAVAVCTYPDSHATYAIQCMQAGAHVFLEKPLAPNVADAEAIVETARALQRQLVVGYILRVHPSWKKLIEISHTLGKPLVMRMNLNQQSHGNTWKTHKKLMETMSPIVDCGVHYVDIMCQMTRAKPVAVHTIGARLSPEISEKMYNYGQLQVRFDDGSIGWYEAGWGPMISDTAYFVKDVIGPNGSVSIVDSAIPSSEGTDHIDAHTKTSQLKLHHAQQNEQGQFVQHDELINTESEPDHQGLCDLEQEFFLNAIRNQTDLTHHWHDAINSLRIVLAADESYRTGEVVRL